MLGTICRLLLEFPDEDLHGLIQELRATHGRHQHRQSAGRARELPAPPRDPRDMERHELDAYLRDPGHFAYKLDLLEFARRYRISVNARTPREEIIRLCVRIIHDIPKGFAVLRTLAERYDPMTPPPAVLAEPHLQRYGPVSAQPPSQPHPLRNLS